MASQHEHRYLRFIGYGLLLLLTFIIQTAPFMIKLFGVYPQPVLILVIIIAMSEGDRAGAGFGLAAGILIDIVSINGSGFHAITFLLTGLMCGLLVEILVQNNIISAMALGSTALILNSLTDWLSKSKFTGLSLNLYFSAYFTSVIYSFVLLIPLYLLFSKIFGFKIRYKPPVGLISEKHKKAGHKTSSVRKRDY